MDQFYVSIIFLGITLIAGSLIWIAFDIKKFHDYESRMDQKKKEMVEIISDSEQMIEELNKFSDFIVTQMDIKNEEVNKCLAMIEEKIKHVNSRIAENGEIKAVRKDKVVNGNAVEYLQEQNNNSFNFSSDLVIDSIEYFDTNKADEKSIKPQSNQKSNVIHLNSKHREVIMLSEKGMSDTEIAKALKMGRGEIQLILGINK